MQSASTFPSLFRHEKNKPHEILGVSEGASFAEIRAAYDDFVTQWHASNGSIYSENKFFVVFYDPRTRPQLDAIEKAYKALSAPFLAKLALVIKMAKGTLNTENVELIRQFIEENRSNPQLLNDNAYSINYDSDTLLGTLITREASDLALLLLSVPGVDVNATYNGTPALLWAVRDGNTAIFNALLSKPTIDVNAKGQYSANALSWAAEKGQVTFVQALLNRPELDNKLLDDALRRAVLGGHLSVVQILLATGKVNVNYYSEREKAYSPTLLLAAVTNGNPDIVKILLDYGADANYVDYKGTPEQVARALGHTQAADVIKEHCAKLAAIYQIRLDRVEYKGRVPHLLCCPFSGKLMSDPIVVSTGAAYDRQTLIKIFLDKKCYAIKCPVTQKTIPRQDLNNATCLFIKAEIEQFVKRQEQAYKQKSQTQVRPQSIRPTDTLESVPAQKKLKVVDITLPNEAPSPKGVKLRLFDPAIKVERDVSAAHMQSSENVVGGRPA